MGNLDMVLFVVGVVVVASVVSYVVTAVCCIIKNTVKGIRTSPRKAHASPHQMAWFSLNGIFLWLPLQQGQEYTTEKYVRAGIVCRQLTSDEREWVSSCSRERADRLSFRLREFVSILVEE